MHLDDKNNQIKFMRTPICVMSHETHNGKFTKISKIYHAFGPFFINDYQIKLLSSTTTNYLSKHRYVRE